MSIRGKAMTYNKKVLVLSIIVGALALIYAGTWVLSPERLNSQASAYVWLEREWLEKVDRLEITNEGEIITLVRKNNQWYAYADANAYEESGDPASASLEVPAKQGRVDDFLRLFSTRAAYPLRGNSPSAHERLGVGENAASRIILRGGAGVPLLDLLIGNSDATGREVYLRKSSQNEVRSGEDNFSTYLSSSRSSWYNLALFPQDGPSAPALDMVQRVTVIAPPSGDEGDAPANPLVISRSAAGWIVEGVAAESLDLSLIEPYIRSILDAEGEDFIPAMRADDNVFNQGRILLEMGDGTSRTIRLGPLVPAGENQPARRSAVVSGTVYVYALTEWTAGRIFRDAAYFEKRGET
jgi:hypothetical protein